MIGAYIGGHLKGAIHIGEAVRFDDPSLIKKTLSALAVLILQNALFGQH